MTFLCFVRLLAALAFVRSPDSNNQSFLLLFGLAAQTEDVCHHLQEHSRSSHRSHQDSLFSSVSTGLIYAQLTLARRTPLWATGTDRRTHLARQLFSQTLPPLCRLSIALTLFFSFSSRRPLDMLSSTPAAPTALRGAIAACQTAQSLRRRLASCTRLKTFQKAWDDRAPSLLLYPAMTGGPDIVVIRSNN